MSTKLNEEIQALTEAESVVRRSYNDSPARQTAVELRLDPLELIKQVQKMREEGLDEVTIRTAFNDVLAQLQGNSRGPARRVLNTVDSVPMPTQEEINKMYGDRYKGIETEVTDPTVKLVIERLEESERARKELANIPKLNIRAKVKVFVVKKLLQFTIFVCKALGVR